MLIQIQGFDDKNNVKFTAEKTIFLDKKNCNLFIPKLPRGRPTSYKKSRPSVGYSDFDIF
jgi:hypothetical protein